MRGEKKGGECETWTKLLVESKRPHNIQRYTVAYSDRLDSGFFAESCGVLSLFFFFLLSCVSGREETNFTVHETNVTVHALFRYCSWDPHPLYSK